MPPTGAPLIGAPGQLEERTLHRSLKRNLVIGLAALGVAAFAGGAYAATQSSGPSTRQAFLNDVAKRLHVTPQQLSSALNGATLDQIQAAVKAGKLTQAQANALEQRLKNGGPAPLLPLTPGSRRPARSWRPAAGLPGSPDGGLRRRRRLRRSAFPGFGLGAAASYLGLSDTQLFQQLQSGKSLAQIATSKGKTVAGLEQAMTAPIKKALDAAVARKAITAAKENADPQPLVGRPEPAGQPEGPPRTQGGAARLVPRRPGPSARPRGGSVRPRVRPAWAPTPPSSASAPQAPVAPGAAAAVHAGAHGVGATLTRFSSISDWFLMGSCCTGRTETTATHLLGETNP